MCYLQWTIEIFYSFYSSVITLCRLHQTDHEAVIVSKPLQGWPKQFDFAHAYGLFVCYITVAIRLLFYQAITSVYKLYIYIAIHSPAILGVVVPQDGLCFAQSLCLPVLV